MTSRTILIKRFVRTVKVTEISLTTVHNEQLDVSSDEFEPSNVLIRKVEQIAELLGCSEEEAQRLVLHHHS